MSGGLIHGEGRGFTSLDYIGQSSISSEGSLEKSRGSDWSRKQKRGYQRLMAHLSYWLQNDYQLLRVDLTTSKEGSIEDITYNFKRLRQMIEKSLGYQGMEYIAVKTNEGNGVLHTVLAWKPKDGERHKSFYIPQRWLSTRWGDIHLSPIVWVKPVQRKFAGSAKCIARYFAAQYLAGQRGYINMFYSWFRTFGFPLGPVWYAFKRHFGSGGYGSLYQCWAELLKGETFALKDGKFLSLLTIKDFYTRWRSGLVLGNAVLKFRYVGIDVKSLLDVCDYFYTKPLFKAFSISDMGVMYGTKTGELRR